MTIYAYILKKELWRPVVRVEVINKGKQKGLFRVTFKDGKRAIASRIIERKP